MIIQQKQGGKDKVSLKDGNQVMREAWQCEGSP